MWSGPGLFKTPTQEDALRFVLTVIDIVGISVSFIGLRAAYIVLGVVFGISIVFNVVITLARSHATRLKIKKGEVISPNIPALAIEIVGAIGFVILYVVATIDTAGPENYWYGDSVSVTMCHAYAGMSGLMAFILHAFLALKRLDQAMAYRRSLDAVCPHCHRGLDNTSNCTQQPRIPSPIALESNEPSASRQSFSANSVGETENDNLIMKV